MPQHTKLRSGQQFGRLTVIRYSHRDQKARLSYWICQCSCGNQKIAASKLLLGGKVKSCGCLKPGKWFEAWRNRAYRSWDMMIARCYNEKHIAFHKYGAKGITVCDSWRSFDGFYKDMGDRPEHTTLDRIDNSKGYEPGNCRWATQDIQHKNRSVTVNVEYEGELMTLTELSMKVGIPRSVLYGRIMQCGWSVAEAISVPVQKRPPTPP